MVDGQMSGRSNTNLPTAPSRARGQGAHGPGLPDIGGQGISSITGADLLIDEVRIYDSYLNDEDWAVAQGGR